VEPVAFVIRSQARAGFFVSKGGFIREGRNSLEVGAVENRKENQI
jgi:hypothetical protein